MCDRSKGYKDTDLASLNCKLYYNSFFFILISQAAALKPWNGHSTTWWLSFHFLFLFILVDSSPSFKRTAYLGKKNYLLFLRHRCIRFFNPAPKFYSKNHAHIFITKFCFFKYDATKTLCPSPFVSSKKCQEKRRSICLALMQEIWPGSNAWKKGNYSEVQEAE